jgi:hypothetical protein
MVPLVGMSNPRYEAPPGMEPDPGDFGIVVMPLSLSASLLTGTLALAGLTGLAGDTPVTASPGNVLYCSGCLCDAQRPVMAVPGTWVPSGTMGTRTTLRFVPSDPNRRIASSCRPPARG